MVQLKKRLRGSHLAALSALVALLGLAGCGPFSSSSEIGKVKEAVQAVLTSNDPGICSRYFTTRFLEAASKKRGFAAIAACERRQPTAGSTASSIRFLAVVIDGGHAVATFQVRGGSLDGRTARAGLVQDSGWRLDELQSSPAPPSPAKQRAIADEGLRTAFALLPRMTQKRADCVVGRLRTTASNAQLADDLKKLKAGQTPPDFLAAFAACK
jgi:hypothetical protein